MQVLFGEIALSRRFAGLNIDLFSPFGTACPNPKCRHPLSLADVRGGWSTDRNKYTTRCPMCTREFVPRFTVHSEAADWMGSEGRGTPLWCEWLSPWVLRKEILSVLFQDGVEALLSSSKSKQLDSAESDEATTIFWNAVVAFRLLGLPYGFLLCSVDGPVTFANVLSIPLDVPYEP